MLRWQKGLVSCLPVVSCNGLVDRAEGQQGVLCGNAPYEGWCTRSCVPVVSSAEALQLCLAATSVAWQTLRCT